MIRKVPVSRDPDKVVGRILAAAEAEFVANGYEAASTNRIVEAFGGSKATLFRHFPTKEALLERVVTRIASQWREPVLAEIETIAEPATWLTAFGVRTLVWILGEGPLFLGRLGIAEGSKLPRLASVFKDMAGAPLERTLSDKLAEWTRVGALYCPNAASDAAHFFDLVVAGPVSRALYGVGRLSGARLNHHVAECVDLFVRARLEP